MRTHLSPLDAVFLELEQADEAAHMHIGWAAILDPPPGGGRPSLEQLREQARARIDENSVLRRRLSSPRVGRRSLPIWLPDPDFDVGQLLRSATLPAPGGESELMAWLGDYFSRRLDRSRPLWETTLLEGLEDGRWALVGKVHHCLVDGVSGASIGAALFDAAPEPEEGVTTLSDLVRLLGEDADRNLLARLRGVLGATFSGGIDAALHPQKVGAILDESEATVEALAVGELMPAPRTSLNGRVGTKRRLATVEAPLEEARQVRRELGGSVNDLVLAVTAGGLRRLFEERGEEVDHVRALVPINLRQASEALAGGDPVSSLFVDLAIAEPDPLRRYRRIAAAREDLKRGPAAGADPASELGSLAPAMTQSTVARLGFTPGLFNLTITNVPASPIVLYALGARMRRAIPLVPISSGHALSVAVISYDGNLTFGLNADRDGVPDLEVFHDGIQESLDALARVAA